MSQSDSCRLPGFSPRLRVLSLFSGIGGLDLGLERAGMEIVAHAEVNPFASRVLAKHWPDAPNLGDVSSIDEFPDVEVIAGGFPCQGFSSAGKRAGLADPRSGLWREMVRAIRVVRPRYVVVENVAALLDGGMGAVLGDLATVGYDAEWDCIPAHAVGAPQKERDRVFIVADTDDDRCDPSCARPNSSSSRAGRYRRSGDCDLDRGRLPGTLQWPAEPAVARMADGLPDVVDAVACLGNAVVPQVSEYVGRLVVDHNNNRTEVAA